MKTGRTAATFALARERYEEAGVDVGAALSRLEKISLSLHCWQGDDVGGFEIRRASLGGGLVATGGYPGKARNVEELRSDAEKAFSLIPGRHRFALHAMYSETRGRGVERDRLEVEHFQGWIDWARANHLGLDFNPTFFSHPKAEAGFTLSHRDRGVREFWIDHGIACRKIGAAIGKSLGTPCVTNVWIPDGYKDTPADRRGPRERLVAALDAVFKTPLSPKHNLDAVEPKLFGIGSESYVTGSHELYLGYAVTRRKLLTVDSGHYHPTESVADKICSILEFLPRIQLHVSRGVRWDSDHVVTLSDEVKAIARELVAGDYLGRVHIGLDYFDASINRIAAWVIGARSMLRALLSALLEPPAIRESERAGDFTSRLAWQEQAGNLPAGAIWDYYCELKQMPDEGNWLPEVKDYEKRVLEQRSQAAAAFPAGSMLDRDRNSATS